MKPSFSLLLGAGVLLRLVAPPEWASAQEAATAQSADQPAPRKDRRVGKLHDKLRNQKALDEIARQDEASPYADYLAFKKKLEAAGITYQFSPGLIVQWGRPHGGGAAVQAILNPNLNWDVFDSKTIGRGSVQFAYSYNRYFGNRTGASLSSNLNVNSLVNDTASNAYSFAQLTYTHEFPGNWLQITAGQFQFAGFDSNAYAGNQQTNFVNVALSQNASQAYIPTSLGAYAQVNPTDTLSFAAGFQDGGNTTGDNIQTRTAGNNPAAWFIYGQWTPSFANLGSAQYSLLYYQQPDIVAQPGIPAQPAGRGWSFNGVQNLNADWGLFVRANNASGAFPTIETSLAGGAIYNNPFGLAHNQIGAGLAWDKTNKAAFVRQNVRDAEVVAETYWNVVVAKSLQVGPDLQIVFDPALDPNARTAGILTFRATGLF